MPEQGEYEEILMSEDEEQWYQFVHVCRTGDINLVQEMLDEGIDPSANHNEALINASDYGNLDVVNLLLTDRMGRVDPSTQNNYAIRLASQYGKQKVVELLLQDPRVDPSDDDNYAVEMASFNGYDEIVNCFIIPNHKPVSKFSWC